MYTEEQSDIHNFVLSELEKISVLLRFLLNHCWTRNINGKEQYKEKKTIHSALLLRPNCERLKEILRYISMCNQMITSEIRE